MQSKYNQSRSIVHGVDNKLFFPRSQNVETSTDKRPMWFIGSEEESVQVYIICSFYTLVAQSNLTNICMCRRLT